MKKTSLLFLTCVLCLCVLSFAHKPKPKVLVFCKTGVYYHTSIPAGIAAIKKIGAENKFDVDTTTDSLRFNDKNLAQYKAVIFLNVTGKLFDTAQKQALMNYVHKGGGIVGVHSATDAEYNWPWYGKMMGGYFLDHPKQQQVKLMVADNSHPATKGLPKEWTRFDEWYNFKHLNPDVHVLLRIDENSYEGGKNGANHPMAWCQNFEGGYVFYTALGHTIESYSEPLFLQHLAGGIMAVLERRK